VLASVRRIAGMPDYEAHVRHLQEHHPGQTIPSRREFYDSYLEARYEAGPTRCC